MNGIMVTRREFIIKSAQMAAVAALGIQVIPKLAEAQMMLPDMAREF